MTDARLAAHLVKAIEMEREIKLLVDTDESPLEVSSGWSAYRYAVGLHKALRAWKEMRAARASQRSIGG